MKVQTPNCEVNYWVPEMSFPKGIMPVRHFQELVRSGSLTKYLRETTSNTIEHYLRFAKWNAPILEETIALEMQAAQDSWIREIEWRYQGKTWVFGRVVIPRASLSEQNQILLTSNKQSIGELLFQDQDLTRSRFEVAKLSPLHHYHQSACLHLNTKPEFLWARRSTFHFHEKPLLVSEVFFPGCFNFLEQN